VVKRRVWLVGIGGGTVRSKSLEKNVSSGVIGELS